MTDSETVRWPPGEGEMARRVREHDWTATPLGPLNGWPRSLKAIVGLLLRSGFPMVALWGPELTQIYNDSYRGLMDLKHPAGLGQATRDCWPEVWHINAPIYERVLRGETLTFEDALYPITRHGTLEDAWFTLTYSPLHDDADALSGVLVTVIETTKQHRIELALRQSEERFRALVEPFAQAVWETDAEGQVVEDSPSWRAYTGQSLEGWLGEGWAAAVHPDDREYALRQWREVVKARQPVNAEFRLRSPEGWRWTNVRAAGLRDASGAVRRWVGMNIDITARKRAEQALRDSESQLLTAAKAAQAKAEEANRAKDEFLATLSHELRTPLAPILLWGRALRSGSVPMNELDRALDAIVHSAESQSRLIEDLLDLSRLQAGKLTLVPRGTSVEELARAALEVLRPSAEAKRLTLELEVQPHLATAVLDPGRFQQVLWKLLSNAIKFTAAPGHVSLRVWKHAGQLHTEVADTGQGIAADFLPHLFQRFRQEDMGDARSHMGLGIGLVLCRHLVELHGGTIEARSEGPGRGAAFTVRIPWVDGAAVAPEETRGTSPTAPHFRPLAGRRVLLVEDDPNTRDVMRWTLECEGAEVRTVASGSEALGVLETLEEQGRAPEVIVCDIGLPGMSGYALIESIVQWCQARGKKAIPACAVSAHAREVDRQRAIAAGFELYLSKPVRAETLIGAVEELAAAAEAP